MNMLYFRYREHPGDFYRNTDVIPLPNPQIDLENFLVQFLTHYQSDERITYVDDLYKFIDDDFYDENDKKEFIKSIGNKTEKAIKQEIQNIEIELKNEAFSNFYNLVRTQQIEILENGKEQ